MADMDISDTEHMAHKAENTQSGSLQKKIFPPLLEALSFQVAYYVAKCK